MLTILLKFKINITYIDNADKLSTGGLHEAE